MLPAIAATVAAAITNALLTAPERAGQPTLSWYSLLATAPLAVATLYWLKYHKQLHRLRPRPGDLALGVATAAALIVAVWAARSLLMPFGSPQNTWLLRLYLQMGDPVVLEKSRGLSLAVLASAVADELVWRGWVQSSLAKRYGERRAAGLTAMLATLSLLPTLVTLSDPAVGLNPLLVLLAGTVHATLSYLSYTTRRLIPGLFAHAVFTYFLMLQFRPNL